MPEPWRMNSRVMEKTWEWINFMPTYGKDKTNEYLSRIRQIVVVKPDVTITQIGDTLKENGINLARNYIAKLVGKIRRERYTRYDHVTINKVLAEFEDFINATSVELLKIAKTSKIDMAKIIAYDTRVKHYNILLDKLFDAGVFERKLGSIDSKYTNVAQVLKILKDERDQQRKLKQGGNGDSNITAIPAESTDHGAEGASGRGESE